MSTIAAKPIRVLQVLSQDDLGGTELMLASLLERLDRSRVESELAILGVPGPISQRLRRSSVPTHSLVTPGGRVSFFGLARLLRSHGFDVVNAYGFKAGLITRFAARLAAPATKVVIGVRGLLTAEVEDVGSAKARLALAAERLTTGLVDAYDSNSRGGADVLAAAGIDSSRIRRIPNGIDLSAWPARNGHALNPVPKIVSVARFVPLKRHQDLIEALADLRHKGVEFRAVLAGSGPMLERCREQARAVGIADRLEFPGRLETEQVAKLLTSADIACLSSRWEGMPGFVMEAMASSLPVVATLVNGVDELVVEGKTGHLVPAMNPVALAEALMGLIEDPDTAARLGAAGRRRISQSYSLDAMVSAKQRLYEEIGGR